jgi:hypothetical protein
MSNKNYPDHFIHATPKNALIKAIRFEDYDDRGIMYLQFDSKEDMKVAEEGLGQLIRKFHHLIETYVDEKIASRSHFGSGLASEVIMNRANVIAIDKHPKEGKGSYLKLTTTPVSNTGLYSLDQRLFITYLNGKDRSKEELIQKMEKIASKEEKEVLSNSNQPSSKVRDFSLKGIVNAIKGIFGRQ